MRNVRTGRVKWAEGGKVAKQSKGNMGHEQEAGESTAHCWDWIEVSNSCNRGSKVRESKT